MLTIILIITFLIVCFVYPSLSVYGRIDFNYIASILYTNNSEALSYIKIIPTHCYLKLLEYLLCTIAIILLDIIKIRWAFLKYTLLWSFLIPPIFAYKSFRGGQLDKEWFIHIAPIKYSILIWSLVDKVKEQNDNIIQESKKKDSWLILNKDSIMLKKNFIIVIGESVRRDFLHCYGFPIENTPFIESCPHIQFDNYISVGSHTIPSLTRTLAYSKHFPHIDLPNNIVKLAKKAGYETYWISNQGYIGYYDSPISIIASASDRYYRATGGNFTVAKEDTDILPIIAKTIEKNDDYKIIFIHMRGSHPSAHDRTKGKYNTFFMSEDISCYVQTVQNMDSFLSKIYADLQLTGKEFSMIYFSDHGLMINNLCMIHGEHVKEVYDVPLLIWDSSIDSIRHIKAIRNGKSFIQLFCEMNNIRTININNKFRFISEDLCDSSISQFVMGPDTVINYNNLRSNSYASLKVNPYHKY